jgi:1-deoxy-D-xylulose-5-phosphate synthase
MLDYAINAHKAPIAIRYPRGSEEYKKSIPYFKYGKAQLLCEGSDFTIAATGRMVKKADEICTELQKDGISCELIALPTIKPLDTETLIKSINKTKNIITLEDGVKIGGMGSAIGCTISEANINCTFKAFAFPDTIIPQGTVTELDEKYGLDKFTISDYIINKLQSLRKD